MLGQNSIKIYKIFKVKLCDDDDDSGCGMNKN